MASITEAVGIGDVAGQTRIMTIIALVYDDKIRSKVFRAGRIAVGSWLSAFQGFVLNVVKGRRSHQGKFPGFHLQK